LDRARYGCRADPERRIAGRPEGAKDTERLPNTTDTVSIAIVKTSDGNTVQAAEGVKQQIEKLKRILPPDISFITTTDQSEQVQENLTDVIVTLALGALLAVVIVYVFLHNLRGPRLSLWRSRRVLSRPSLSCTRSGSPSTQ
jgi:hypothetical protein